MIEVSFDGCDLKIRIFAARILARAYVMVISRPVLFKDFVFIMQNAAIFCLVFSLNLLNK